MKFAEFREEIIKAYMKHFPEGHCAVEIYKCLGNNITIDCHISPNGRCGNDMMMVCLRLELPDKFNVSENDLPESVTLEAWRNYYMTNPDNKYTVYGSNKAAFRKSSGTPEKIVTVAEKFFSRLYESIKADYLNGRIHKDHAAYVQANIKA